MKKVHVLVLATGGPWIPLIEAIRETWGMDADPDFRISYYYGCMKNLPHPGRGKSIRTGDVIVCGCGEAALEILKKTLIAYEHVLKEEPFDYIFRCCCGSYINKLELQKFIEDKPTERFYCGIIGRGKIPYASGSGYFLSRDLVEEIVRNKETILKYPYLGKHDDISIGRFVHDFGVKIDPRATRVNQSFEIKTGAYHYHFGLTGGAPCMRKIHAGLKKEQP